MDYYEYTTNQYQIIMDNNAMEYNGFVGDLNDMRDLANQGLGDRDHRLQSSLSLESYSSCPTTTNFNCLNNNNNNSNNNGASSHVPATARSNSVGSFSSTSEILSFSANTNDNLDDIDPQSLYFSTSSVIGEKQRRYDHLKTVERQGTYKKGVNDVSAMARAPHLQDHIIAERKRREKLNQGFATLSSLIPGLTKIDKASILGHAIKYVKQMQDRVQTLEEQAKERSFESAAVVLVKKPHVTTDASVTNEGVQNDESSVDDGHEYTDDIALPEIEARVLDKDLLLRIHCDRQRGLLGKLLTKLGKLQLSVGSYSIMPFGNHLMVITIIAQMEAETDITASDLVQQVRAAF